MAVVAALDPLAVAEFGRREIASVLGEDFDGRVFLAGGAFRTLLTGRSPRDLDLWGPTPEDRDRIVARLEAQGRRAARHPFSDAFVVDGRDVEVPDMAEPPTLEERLARFDLALSAVGVEWLAGAVRAGVHPLAMESVERREVLLLKPLVNWRHCLSTLARARRYAEDLGYSVPAEEEAVVWRTFDEQHADMQRGMIERYERAAMRGWGVGEEAEARTHVR
ncbi:MAG: hypothetical protein FJ102_09710 [Deltaproteobacteria bacterium]|nr:hypothetical protein [Deltaproteobacteria bacterium]